MKISKLFELKKTQAELDFVDIDPERDVALFLDSQLIGASNHVFADRCHNTISNFFSLFLELIQEGERDQARELFSYLSEPNETCLGSSKGEPAGRGVGVEQASDIFESIMGSRAIETGVLDHLEDFRIFVHGVGPDKVSDMTTNIIRKNLIEYTQNQCALHNIPMRPAVATNPWWNAETRQWESSHETMLVINHHPILLVPKSLVSRGVSYSFDRYHRQWVLNFVKRDHLASNGPHVRRRKPKKGQAEGEAYVTKGDMAKFVAPPNKDYVAGFTQKHPKIFKDFKEFSKENAKPLTNTEINSTVDMSDLCQYLIKKLVKTPSGNDDATNYHHLIIGILELIFYPNLTCPVKEKEINDGRKRIDLVFDNSARSGQFYNLHQIRKITSPYIMVECKNYGTDVANPEVDQLAGRFSINRGRFGMLLCRSVKNYKKLIQRCQDTHNAQNGLIIPILDDDLIKILNAKAQSPQSRPEEDFLAERIREVAMG
ncbi:hypothetical protein [Paraherbaspirillum soli]|uniref:Restriction endonuclease type IV Mrr domain-containing protein n=1 Tax=Paraherbaspirillum soli TaxID=631222 RepID=A0ABW0M5K8_9BURK